MNLLLLEDPTADAYPFLRRALDNYAPPVGFKPDLGHPINRQLRGWWPVNEGGGKKAHDISAFSSTGTLTNHETADWKIKHDGRGNRVHCLDSDNTEYVDLGAKNDLNDTSLNLTLSCWYNSTNTLSGTDLLLGNWISAGKNTIGLFFYDNFNGNGSKFIHGDASSGNWATDPNTANDGKWHLLTGIKRGSTTEIWRDGKLIDTGLAGSNFGGTFDNFQLGGGASGTAFPYVGLLRDARIWTRALDKNEVWNLYTRPYESVRQATIVLVIEGQTIEPTGIASAEAFGSHTVSTPTAGQTISPTGIASAEAFGTAQLNMEIDLLTDGIATAEAFGTAIVAGPITCTGIVTSEAFGTTQLNMQIVCQGITTEEAFGSAIVAGPITCTGIASAEAFGTANLQDQVVPDGIASAEAFGNATLNMQIDCQGITSAEAFGTQIAAGPITCTGIASAEGVGVPTVTLGDAATGGAYSAPHKDFYKWISKSGSGSS